MIEIVVYTYSQETADDAKNRSNQNIPPMMTMIGDAWNTAQNSPEQENGLNGWQQQLCTRRWHTCLCIPEQNINISHLFMSLSTLGSVLRMTQVD